MTVWSAPARPAPTPASVIRAGVSLTFLLVICAMVVVGESVGRARDVVAAVAAVALVGIASRSPRLLLPATVVWLTALGLTRRVVTELGSGSHLDPLLLVGPLGLALLAVSATRRGAMLGPSRLTKAVLILSLLILLGAANPLQGSILTGASSLLFVLVPTFGFWIGRVIDDRALRALFALLAALGVVVAVYGLLQTLSGFPSWDKHWIARVDLGSLDVGGVIRPFSTFSSAAEYAEYLCVAIAIWVAAAFRPRFAPISIVALALLVPALVLESSRGAAVIVLVATGVMLGAWRRVPLAVAAVIGALLLAALSFGLRSYASTPTPTVGAGSATLVSHEVNGLTEPFNSQHSTLGAHLTLIGYGVREALRDPVGRGTGTVTIAGSTFGGTRFGTEADPSNMAVALGVPGLLAYLVVAVLALRVVYQNARVRRDVLSLAALGILIVTVLQWLNGGLYSVAFLPWVVLGWADSSIGGRR
jgi:hypothetical protein